MERILFTIALFGRIIVSEPDAGAHNTLVQADSGDGRPLLVSIRSTAPIGAEGDLVAFERAVLSCIAHTVVRGEGPAVQNAVLCDAEDLRYAEGEARVRVIVAK